LEKLREKVSSSSGISRKLVLGKTPIAMILATHR